MSLFDTHLGAIAAETKEPCEPSVRQQFAVTRKQLQETQALLRHLEEVAISPAFPRTYHEPRDERTEAAFAATIGRVYINSLTLGERVRKLAEQLPQTDEEERR